MSELPSSLGSAEAEKFRALAWRLPIGLALLDDQGRFIYVNEAAIDLLGQSEAELLGVEAMSLAHPSLKDELREVFARMITIPNHRERRSVRLRDATGKWRWLDASAVNLLDLEAVRAVALQFTAIATLEPVEAEAEALQNREMHRRIVGDCPGAIVVTNRSGTITHANLAGFQLPQTEMARVLELNVSEFFGRVFREDGTVLPVEEFPSNKCFRTGHPEPATTIGVLRRDHSMMWVVCLTMPLPAAGGQEETEAVVLTLLDVTERRRMEMALQAALEEQSGIMGAIPEYVWSVAVSPDGTMKLRYVSPGVTRITGRSAEFFTAHEWRWLTMVHPADRERVKAMAFRLISGQSDREEDEYRIIRADGEERIVRDNVLAHQRHDGTRQLNGVVSDVTDRRRMEDDLRKGEETLRLAMEVSSLGFWDSDPLTGEIKWSDSLFKVCGVEAGAFTPDPESILALIHPEDRERVLECYSSAQRTRRSLTSEFRIVSPDGIVRWLASKAQFRFDDQGRAHRMIGVAADITDRMDADQKLRQNATDLHHLSRQLMEVQETERRRLSRELHDQVGQALTAVQINLQSVQAALSDEALMARLNESTRIVEDALELVRNLSLDLRPLLLDDLGLLAALRWYSNRIAQRAGLRCVFLSDAVPSAVDSSVETACFRVAQEALTNVVRHASASCVTVELRCHQGLLKLFVLDDGIGTPNGRSVGLIGMEERVLLAGGALDIRFRPGEGTEVEACFPLTPLDPGGNVSIERDELT